MIIVITGVPGTGKTTISKELAKRLNGIHIDLCEFSKKEKYIIEYDPVRETFVIDEEKVIRDIEEIIKKEKEKIWIIEGHFAHLIDNADIYIVLRCDPNELAKRLKERGYPDHKIFENVWAMNLEVIEDELESMKKNYYVINTTNKNVDEVVNEIISIIVNHQR